MQDITFRSYSTEDKAACLELFDANCPEFFSPNERADYDDFLDAEPGCYELCSCESRIVGAFGLIGDDSSRRDLNWILLDPSSQGLGIGTAIMDRVASLARGVNVQVVCIAASHKSAPFFAKFGASKIAETTDGWGPGMHKVDMELLV